MSGDVSVSSDYEPCFVAAASREYMEDNGSSIDLTWTRIVLSIQWGEDGCLDSEVQTWMYGR